MKMLIAVLLGLNSLAAWSIDVKDFNRALIDNVKKDVENDNDEDLKVKKYPSRKPASINNFQAEPEPKIDKLKQIGPSKW